MPDLNVDTSSYPKPVAVAPTNPLDTLGKITAIQQGQQNLQSGGLTIDKQKLDLINQRFGTMVKDFTALMADPDLNEDKIRKRIETDVKLGVATPEMAGTFITQLPPTQGLKGPQAAQVLRDHLGTWLGHAQTIKEAIDTQLGQPQLADTGGSLQPITVSPLPGRGIRSTGLPIQKTLPPTTPGYNNGEPGFAPSQPGSVAAPPPAVGSGLPAQRSVAQPQANNQNPNPPATFAPGPPPLFEEGKKALDQDLALSTQKLTAIKPALLALPLMDKITSGPGTKLWNEGIAGLKAQGIISEGTANDDKTAIYQQANKYMNDYLSRRGGATDAAREQLMRSSPDLGSQINPALRKLTQTAIAQDRIEAARGLSYGDRKDLQNYLTHRAQFPSSMDERAFTVDAMNDEERQHLAKEIQKMKPEEKARFMRSLKTYEDTKVGTY